MSYRRAMYRIAVIDDDPEVNKVLSDWVREILPGCEISNFFDLNSSLGALNVIKFDLVISDVDLGDGSDKFGGFKIAKALDTQRVPLLVVSGSSEHEMQEGVFTAMEAWDYLQKPVSSSDFALQVKRAIAFRRSAVESSEVSDGEFPLVPDLKISRRGRHFVEWKGQRLKLSLSQMDIVETLASDAGRPAKDKVLFEFLTSGKNIPNLRVKMSAIRLEFQSVDPTFDKIKPVPIGSYMWRID